MKSHKKHKKYNRHTPPELYGYDPVRDKGITELYKKGWTLEQIGKKHGLTRERIRQIIARDITKVLKNELRHGRYPNPDHKSVKHLVKDEIKEITRSRARNRVLSKIEEAREMGVVPERFNSKAEYAQKLGLSVGQIQRYAPKVINIIRENIPVGYGGKKWSRYYLRCKNFGTATVPHHSHGYCENCFTKTDIFKDLQRASRLRNQERWKPKQTAYLDNYYNQKNYGGNRYIVLERDGYQCVKCHITEEEHQNKYGQRLRVVHLESVDDNSLGNLATLCRECALKRIYAKRSQ